MFVLIADIQGSHITVAYGYLPDKKQMSYALFLYLILDAFEAYQEDFRAITGRIHLKLRVIVSDYEVSIHLAFSVLSRHSHQHHTTPTPDHQ